MAGMTKAQMAARIAELEGNSAPDEPTPETPAIAGVDPSIIAAVVAALGNTGADVAEVAAPEPEVVSLMAWTPVPERNTDGEPGEKSRHTFGVTMASPPPAKDGTRKESYPVAVFAFAGDDSGRLPKRSEASKMYGLAGVTRLNRDQLMFLRDNPKSIEQALALIS